MKKLTVFLICFLTLLPVGLAQERKPTLLEQKYGPNLAEIHRQAEAEWVRDHHTIIFDFQDHRNKYVSMQSDDELIHMLQHSRTRENVRISEANLTPYVNEVKKRRGLKVDGPEPEVNDTNETEEVTEDNESDVKRPQEEKPSQDLVIVECVRNNSLTVFDPLYRVNRWTSMISDATLKRIVLENDSIGRNCR